MDEPTEKPVELNNEQKLIALTKYAKNLEFFSDTTRYRPVIYNGINDILTKLSEIEARLILIEGKDGKI